MVILNLKLNNILAFNNFEINFSYPMKLRTTSIENESLENLPSFRYKKVNVFIGSNASGKTSLMKAIWKTVLFLAIKEADALYSIFNNFYNEGYIEIDFAEDTKDIQSLNRVKIKIFKDNAPNILVSHNSIRLGYNASYENSKSELDSLPDHFENYITSLQNFNVKTGWNVILPATETRFDLINILKTNNEKDEREYIDILNRVFKTLDNSIIDVRRSLDTDNAIVIKHLDMPPIIVQHGNKISSMANLSSGTKYGFNIANMIYSIKNHLNTIYIMDEQFSYVSSDIEAAILATIVELLGPDEQLFFTTHNASILELGFPFHTFNFMKKENIDNKQYISVNCASEAENRNNVSVKTLLDNDAFSTAPDVEQIMALGDN